MRFVAFSNNGQPALGLHSGAEVIDLTREGLPATLDELLRLGPAGFEAARTAAAAAA